MKGEDKPLLKLMDGSDNRFIIPVYQRNYDWGEPQCEQLYSDLIDINRYNRASHFFGCIVRTQSKGGKADEYLIIDGQQRITTICLIFLAMYWNIKNGNLIAHDDKLSEKIFKKFIVDEYEVKEKKIRLKLNKEDRAAFDHLVDFGDEGDFHTSNVVVNYKYFYEELQKLPFSVDDFYEAIKKLVVIDIFLGDEDDPQLIFESLNSTGLDLTEADKIRNYVLMGLEEEKQDKYYTNYWSYIEKDCSGNKELDNFIRDYLTLKSPTGEIPKFQGIYSAFKKFSEGKDIEEILVEMKKYAAVYSKIQKADVGSPDANAIMARINYLDQTVTYSYLMGVISYAEETNMSEEELTKILSCIEIFVFRRLICGYPTNALNKIFATLHQQVLKNKKDDVSYYDVLVFLLENRKKTIIFPNDDEFLQNFLNKPIYTMRPKSRTYIFDRLENGNSKEKNDIIKYVERGDLSVEHIMPQILTKNWEEALGPDYIRIHDQWLHTIANLTLTGYNSQYSNRTFAEKKADKNGFANSGLRLNQYIAQFDKWTEEELKKRQEKIKGMAIVIWPYPITSYKPVIRPDDEVSIGDEEFSFTGRKIKQFSFLGTPYPVVDWTDALVSIFKLFYELDPEVLVSEAKNKDNTWIVTDNADGLITRKKISENVWVVTANDTNTKLRLIRQISRMNDFNDDDIVFSLIPQDEDKKANS